MVEEEDDGDFLQKQGKIRYDIISKFTSKTKPDVLTEFGFLNGLDYTLNQ